jgi:hypothetical protein
MAGVRTLQEDETTLRLNPVSQRKDKTARDIVATERIKHLVAHGYEDR